MKRKVSMQQIADAVGVSKYAVSKALAGKEGVSPATRLKIVETAKQMGYNKKMKSASHAYRAMPEQQASARTVAVLMPNVRQQTADSSFWGEIMRGIATELDALGIGMFMITENTAEYFAHILNPDEILGIIGVGQIGTPILTELRQRNIPFVLTDHEESLVPCDTVFANNADSMAVLTAHLLGMGHRSFLFLGDTEYSRSFADRFAGFRNSLDMPGIGLDRPPARLPLSGNDREDNRQRVKEWLSACGGGQPLPTAWVCANDMIALSVMEILQEEGIQIPEDVSVSGFDNIEGSARSQPALSTVDIGKSEMGRRAVRCLFDRLANPSGRLEKILLSCELIKRDSIAAPASSSKNKPFGKM